MLLSISAGAMKGSVSSKLSQWLKALGVKAENLSLILGPHLVEGKKQLCSSFLTSTDAQGITDTAPPQTQKNKC